MAATCVFVPWLSSSCLLPLWEALHYQQMGLTQAPFKLLLLPWALEHVRFCVSYNSPLALLKVYPAGLQSQKFWGLFFLVQGPQAGETKVRLRPLTLWGEPLQL